MKFKKHVQKKYHFLTKLGEIYQDTVVLQDESGHTYLEEPTVDKLSRMIAYKFWVSKNKMEDVFISADEIAGIIYLTQLNKAQFAQILGLTKSSITQMIKGKKASKQLYVHMLDVIAFELMFPNYWKNKLEQQETNVIDELYMKKILKNEQMAA